MPVERLQKILAKGGVASRRAAELLITAGRVRVNGRIVTDLGSKADGRADTIEVDGRRVVREKFVYVLVHKPRGVVATVSDPEGRPTVCDLLGPVATRLYPVGRLDFHTSGVLLLTNDGDFTDGMLHPKRSVPKTYVMKVSGVLQEPDFERLRLGVRLEDGMTLPAEAYLIRHEEGKTWLSLTIREGRNQQVRRMLDALGFPVMRLARTAFAGITAEGLKPGAFRHLSRAELVDIRKTWGVPRSVPAAEAIAQASRELKPPARPRVRTAGERADLARGTRAVERAARAERPEAEGRARPERGGARSTEGRARPERGGARSTERSARPERGGARSTERSARPERSSARSTERSARPERGGARPEQSTRPERAASPARSTRPERAPKRRGR